MSKEFCCLRCGYTSNRKNNLKTHLKRKNKCPPTLQDIELNEINIKKIIENSFDENEKKEEEILITKINHIDNFMYILQEREFVNAKQNIYKIGITKNFSNRVSSYPKGSKVYCVKPVEGDPENNCLRKFRDNFISRVDIGSEYFEGDINLMINTLFTCTI